MVTRLTNTGSFSTAGQERVEQTAQQAGIADGLGHMARLAPQVLALQQSLLAGIVRSQQREAKRLARLYGEEDARIARAIERASQVSQLHREAKAQGAVVERIVQTFQQDGIFHGYVQESDGTSAVGYTLKLEMYDANNKRLQHGSAKTDDSGYFRMDLRRGTESNPQDVRPVRRWTDRLARLVTDELESVAEAAEEKAAATDQGSPAAASGLPGVTSSVEVLDTKGRLVLKDPYPPVFEASASEFRYYVVGDAAGTKTGGIADKKA